MLSLRKKKRNYKRAYLKMTMTFRRSINMKTDKIEVIEVIEMKEAVEEITEEAAEVALEEEEEVIDLTQAVEVVMDIENREMNM